MNANVLIFLSLTAVVLAGCEQGSPLISKAKVAVASRLFDPEAAKFRNVNVIEKLGWKTVCGEINGKNQLGAYVGFKRFGWDLKGDIWFEGDRVQVRLIPDGATADDRFFILDGQKAAQQNLDLWTTQCS